jgi:hypothetical protein
VSSKDIASLETFGAENAHERSLVHVYTPPLAFWGRAEHINTHVAVDGAAYEPFAQRIWDMTGIGISQAKDRPGPSSRHSAANPFGDLKVEI